jgi:hypothetical protein
MEPKDFPDIFVEKESMMFWYLYEVSGTEYYMEDNSKGWKEPIQRFEWYKDTEGGGDMQKVSFEEVFYSLPSFLQEELVYFMDELVE